MSVISDQNYPTLPRAFQWPGVCSYKLATCGVYNTCINLLCCVCVHADENLKEPTRGELFLLNNLKREKAVLEREEAELEREIVKLRNEKSVLERENARLDGENAKLAFGKKSELEVGMGTETDELKAGLKKLREEKAKVDKSYLLLKVQ